MNILENNPKLLSIEETVRFCKDLQSVKKRVVLTNGCFDLLHSGHLYFLSEARKLGDALIVMLNSEESVQALKGPTRPVQGNLERAYSLAALSFVDCICVFSTKRLDTQILQITPDIYAKAGDYTIETLDKDELQALRKVNTDIKILPFLEGFSTTKLIEKIAKAKNTF